MTLQQTIVSLTKKGRLGAGGMGFLTLVGAAALIGGAAYLAKKAYDEAQKKQGVQQ